MPARTFGRASPLRRVAPVPAQPPAWRASTHPLARRWDRWCRAIERRCEGLDPAVDLRAAIGTRRWFGGVARLAVLALPALACLPGFVPFQAMPLPIPGDGAARELRALAISPLGQGAASGRHFAATDQVARLDSVPERATIALDAVLGENDDLARMLQRVGLSGGDAASVKTLVQPLVPAGGLAPGTRFAITLGARAAAGEARPLLQLSFRPQFDLDATVERHGGGALALIRRPIPIDSTPLHLEGPAGSSLYRSERAAGAAPDTVQAWLQAIDQYMPFEAILPGDLFELVVAHKSATDDSGARAGQDGDLLYAGVVRDGKPLLQVMRWGNDGNYYTADALADSGGGSSGQMLMAAPVAGNITSWFGMRHHPILGIERLHAGVDFGAPYGSPIYAASDGVVSYAGWHGGHGNYVRIAHGGGIDTAYGHMSRFAVGVGAHVARGQVIGYVGATGLATGPHLHYELWRNGQPINPLSMRFAPHHTGVGPQELAAFRARMAQLLAVPRVGG